MNVRIPALAVSLALLALAPVASAQRASLAERVASLEQRAAADQGNVDLLNQVTALKSEVQALRAQIEELQHQQQQMEESSRNQYLDLDGRINRIEGGAAAAPPAAPVGGNVVVPPPSRTAAAPAQPPAPAASGTTPPARAAVAAPGDAERVVHPRERSRRQRHVEAEPVDRGVLVGEAARRGDRHQAERDPERLAVRLRRNGKRRDGGDVAIGEAGPVPGDPHAQPQGQTQTRAVVCSFRRDGRLCDRRLALRPHGPSARRPREQHTEEKQERAPPSRAVGHQRQDSTRPVP